MNRLEVEDLRVTYPFGQRTLAGVSLAIPDGERVLVCGPSGCGKSTLAAACAGLVPRVIDAEMEGAIRVDGLEIGRLSALEAARRVGMVFQDPESQACLLRVDDEMCFGLENLGVAPSSMPDRVRGALAQVGLSGFERREIQTLSGGEMQRLALAAVLATRPAILVLDEPTANLDPRTAEEVAGVVHAACGAEGRTALWIEHRLTQTLLAGIDRVVALDAGGGVLADGAPLDVLYRPEVRRTGIWLPPVVELAMDLLGPERARAEAVGDLAALARALPAGAADARPCGDAGCRPSGPVRLAAEGLRVTYPSSPPAIDDVCVRLHAGRVVAILGANGSGKSTLLLALSGLVAPQAGRVMMDGRSVAELAAREIPGRIGLVFQNPEHQFVTDTVWDELAYGLGRHLGGSLAVNEAVESLLRTLRLWPHRHHSPFSLSQGEKRRLSVGAAVITRPQVLLLDEPTYGQDRETAFWLGTYVRERAAEGHAVAVATHDMEWVDRFCTDALVLDHGRKLFAGPVDDLWRRSRLLERASLVAPARIRLEACLTHAG